MPSAARAKTRNIEIIWASTREVFNVVETDAMGCHIITPADVLKKLALATKTAAELSLERSGEIFRDDAVAAGLPCGSARVRPKSVRISALQPALVCLLVTL